MFFNSVDRILRYSSLPLSDIRDAFLSGFPNPHFSFFSIRFGKFYQTLTKLLGDPTVQTMNCFLRQRTDAHLFPVPAYV